MFEFLSVWVFLLLPAPLIAYGLLPAADWSGGALRVPFFDRIKEIAGKKQPASRLFRWLLLGLMWLLLLTAAAQPVWIGDAVALPSTGRNLMLAVDISGSMEQRDMVFAKRRVSRLDAVKQVVGDFVIRRHGDRMGLILFGSQAYLQTPLTFDRKTLFTLLNEAQIGFAGEKTAIGDAIGLAVKRLQDKPETSRILILLTDGTNTAGSVTPTRAAALARQSGVTVYTIFVGPDQRRTNRYMDSGESVLREIASSTGGQYFRAQNTEELQIIYQQLDQLEPVEQDKQFFRPQKSLFYWPLSGTIALTFLWLIAIMLKRKRQTVVERVGDG